jgi:hypothetical protein
LGSVPPFEGGVMAGGVSSMDVEALLVGVVVAVADGV